MGAMGASVATVLLTLHRLDIAPPGNDSSDRVTAPATHGAKQQGSRDASFQPPRDRAAARLALLIFWLDVS